MSQFPVKLAISGVIGVGLLLGGVTLFDTNRLFRIVEKHGNCHA